MSIIKKTGLLGCLFAISLSSQAQMYVGAGIGSADLDSDLDTDSSIGYDISFGHNFNEYFALELSYVDFSEFDVKSSELDAFYSDIVDFFPGATLDASSSVSISGLEIAIIGALPITEKFALTGRLGNFSWDADVEVDVAFTFDGQTERSSDSQKADDSDISWGIGAKYEFNDQLSATFDYRNYKVEDADVGLFGAGIQYAF